MITFWKKKQPTEQSAPQSTPDMQWEPAAQQSIAQAVAQAPVPGLLKGKVKTELEKAAREAAQQAGRTTITADDVVTGMLAKMPAAMRTKVETAMRQGPDALKNLEKELRHQK